MIADPKILIIEDNQSDADLLRRELKRSGLIFTSEIVQTREAFEFALLHFKPDIILSDYSLPAFDAVSAFRIKQVDHSHIPFIIVSGIIGEENAVELIKDGVTDYASKSKLFSLSVKIKRALNEVEEKKEKLVTDQKLKTQTAELVRLNQELEEKVKRRTVALSESENRFRNMMETIPQIAWTTTIGGAFIFFNQRWYDYTGLDPRQTRTSGLNSAIHPDDLEKSAARFSQIRLNGTGGEFQLRGKRSDGVYRWHLIRLMPIRDENDQVQLWVGTATDIEELRQLQQHKDDFISIASHELKTPITSLKVSLQLLYRMKDNPSAKMLPILIQQANKSLDKVNVLIEDLLNASNANEGQLHISPKNFQLSDLITECCQYLTNEGNYKITTDGDMEVSVFADAARIEQVVTNLVNNAIKYAPESKEIKISIGRVNGMARVSVSDKGPGIAAAKQPLLFDRYYRINNSGSNYTGLGLGLYICAEIIRVHNGEIGVDSEIGIGSTFWFSLPVAITGW